MDAMNAMYATYAMYAMVELKQYELLFSAKKISPDFSLYE